MDLVAVCQSAVGITEIGEAGVDEPIILCTHPAGVGTTGELCECTAVFLDRCKIRCTVVIAATVPCVFSTFERLESNSHHTVAVGQIVIPVNDGLLQAGGQRLVQIRRVFDDDMDAANILRIREERFEVFANFAGFRGLPDSRHLLHCGDGFLSGGNDIGFGRCAFDFFQTVSQRCVKFVSMFLIILVCGNKSVVLRLDDVRCSFPCRFQLRAVTFDRPPCDRDGHIVVGHCKAEVGVWNVNVDYFSGLALVARIIIDALRAADNVGPADTFVCNALDFILGFTDLDGQVPLRTVHAGGGVCAFPSQNNAEIFVADRPSGALRRICAFCIACLEICRVVNAGINPNRCQRVGFAEGFREQLRFAVVSAEGVRRYDIDSLCIVVFAALCAVHLGRIVAQIVDHGVQRSG